MNDVAIIGVGLHPFGRFDKSAMQMGAEAIQQALRDAGTEWKDIQFGVGGSYEISNLDAVTRLVGLTGIPFTNVFNACATAATATQVCADNIGSGKYDIGIAIGTISTGSRRRPWPRLPDPTSPSRGRQPAPASAYRRPGRSGCAP